MSARDGVGKDAMYHDLRRKGLGTICAWDVANMPPPDRLALARALVADMPEVVVAEVGMEADHMDADPRLSADAAIQWAEGYNACRTAILDQKEPKP